MSLGGKYKGEFMVIVDKDKKHIQWGELYSFRPT